MKNNVQEDDKMKEGLHWFDNKRNIKRIIYALYVICAALFLAEFFAANIPDMPAPTTNTSQ